MTSRRKESRWDGSETIYFTGKWESGVDDKMLPRIPLKSCRSVATQTMLDLNIFIKHAVCIYIDNSFFGILIV